MKAEAVIAGLLTGLLIAVLLAVAVLRDIRNELHALRACEALEFKYGGLEDCMEGIR